MITSSGVRCDVCGRFILYADYQPFSIKGIDRELHCHVNSNLHTCKADLQAAADDWHKLPAGPLREAFEKAEATTTEEGG